MLLDAAMLGRGTAFGDAVTIAAEGEDKTEVVCRMAGTAGVVEFRTFGAWAEPGVVTLATGRSAEGNRSLPTIARNLPQGGKADLSQESAKRAILSGSAGSLSYRIPLEAKGFSVLPLAEIPVGRQFASLPVTALLQARAIISPIVGEGRNFVKGFDHLHFRAEGKEVTVQGTDGFRAVRYHVAELQYPPAKPFGWSVQREGFDLLCRLLHRQRGLTARIIVRDEAFGGGGGDSYYREARTVARLACLGNGTKVQADLYGMATPPWDSAAGKIFPSAPDVMTLTVNRGLLQQWTRVMVSSHDAEDVITIASLGKDSITIGTKHGGSVILPAAVHGEGSFYIQGRLLLSSIAQWPGKSVTIGYCGKDDTDSDKGGLPLRLTVPGDRRLLLSLMPLHRGSVEAGDGE